MIIVLKPNVKPEQMEELNGIIADMGVKSHAIEGTQCSVIGLVGNVKGLNKEPFELLPYVERVLRVSKPYKLVSREAKEEDTVITVGDVRIGGEELTIMAGPCALENYEQILETAEFLKGMGVKILRGGTFKPRTSPYAFQGMGNKGLDILAEVKRQTGMLIVSEVMDADDVEAAADIVDILQIGTRNMQNFRLLKSAGASGKPVVLKRGIAATIEEWLMAAEYIASEGNTKIILCERGIRTYETATRNTLDISAIPVLKSLSHLPVIVDPSHSAGDWKLVPTLAKASVAAGADGLLIEVHRDPANALCDGAQSLTHKKFDLLYSDLGPLAKVCGRLVG